MTSLKNLAQRFSKTLVSYANEPNEFASIVSNYENYSELIMSLVQAMRERQNQISSELDMSDPANVKSNELLMKKADIIESVIPKLEAVEAEISGLQWGKTMTEEETPISPTVRVPYTR